MSTLNEIKAAAATLPVEDRSELVAWLSESKDVWEIRRDQLRREIQAGLDDIERGEVAPPAEAAQELQVQELQVCPRRSSPDRLDIMSGQRARQSPVEILVEQDAHSDRRRERVRTADFQQRDDLLPLHR